MERRFPLQAVLNYRNDLEEALQLELGRLQGEEHVAGERLATLRSESERTLTATGELLAQARPEMGTVQQGFVYLDALQRSIDAELAELAELAAKVEAKRREVVEAMQARKVLEKLKQRHERAYADWVRRVEQRLVDDMTTVRHNRRMAEEGSGS
ncbi:MAG TPA: flagellar export protein FliJ [Chloroflexota bacterium]|jgi:flagellar FliJ protein